MYMYTYIIHVCTCCLTFRLLHAQTNQILHRRLGARNVLLQTDPVTKQVRAKLAGFGPLKGEQEGADENKKV